MPLRTLTSVVLGIMVLGLAIATLVMIGSGGDDARGGTTIRSRPIRSGDQLVLVYIGGSSCGSCNEPTLKEAVQRLLKEASQWAAGEEQQFSTIGVALDWSVPDGVDYLARLGPFVRSLKDDTLFL